MTDSDTCEFAYSVIVLTADKSDKYKYFQDSFSIHMEEDLSETYALELATQIAKHRIKKKFGGNCTMIGFEIDFV